MSLIWTTELRFALALALGFLVGLERERSRSLGNLHAAGVRTHCLVSLFGFGLAVLARQGWTAPLPVGLAAVAGLSMLSFLHRVREGRGSWTSEAAVLLTFLSGVLCLAVDVWIPMALAVVGTFLLGEKAEIERRVPLLETDEFLGVLKFLLVTVIVLPVLPDRGFTRFGLNPASIWKIVAMVSTVGFAGYFLVKKLGGRAGLWVSGLVGGVVSSTAVAVATGRMARADPAKGGAALQAAILGSSVMYLRILALVWIVSPTYGRELSWRLPLLALAGVALAATTPARASRDGAVSNLSNPFEVAPALVFAGFFALFTVATGVVREWLGNAGMVVLALVVGTVDIDPFILSVSRSATIEPVLVTAILLAMLSNTLAKGFYFGSQAASARRQAFLRYGLWALVHLPLALL